MCLTVVHKRKPAPTGRGWKVFYEKHDKTLQFRVQGGEAKRGEWLTAHEKQLCWNRWGVPQSAFHYYTSGFHIYTKKPKFMCYNRATCVVAVRYRGAHTQGTQQGYKGTIIVARELYVPKTRTKAKP